MSKSLGFFEQIAHFHLRLLKMSDLYVLKVFLEVVKKKQKAFLLSEVRASFRSLMTNEQPGAIRSGCSEGMSDHEQIAQVAHQK